MTLLERIVYWTIMGILGLCALIVSFAAGFWGMSIFSRT